MPWEEVGTVVALTVIIGTSDVVVTRYVLCDAVELSAAVPVLITLRTLTAVVTS